MNRLGLAPQIGDVWSIACRPHEREYNKYHLLIVSFFETVPYRNDTCAARCIVLETDEVYEMYVDELYGNGERVA